MPTLTELREKRAELIVKVRAKGEEFEKAGRAFNPDQDAEWESISKDFREADAAVIAAEKESKRDKEIAEHTARIAEIETKPNRKVGTDEVVHIQQRGEQCFEAALRCWGMMGDDRLADEITTDQKEAFTAYRRHVYDWGRNRGAKFGAIDKENFSVRLDSGYGFGREVSGRAMARSGAEFRARWAQSIASQSRAAMGVSIDTLGGFAVPEGFTYNLEEALRAYGGIREHATITRTETANPLPFPTIVDTTPGNVDPVYSGALVNVGELLGENAPTSLQGLPPQMGALILGAQKFSSKLMQISHELLRDAAFNMASYLGKIAGSRLGRIMAQKWAFGSGAGIVPRGIGKDAPISQTTAVAGVFGYDDLIKFRYTVDPAYRMPGACFLLHDQLILSILLIKDGFGRPLFVESAQAGEPDKLNGYPIQRVQEMPYDFNGDCIDGTTNNALVIFGYVPLYQIREVQTMRLKRLVERFAEYDQEGFIGFFEADGGLLDAGTRPVKALANNGQPLGAAMIGGTQRLPNSISAEMGEMVGEDDKAIDENAPPPRALSREDLQNAANAVKAAQSKGKKD